MSLLVRADMDRVPIPGMPKILSVMMAPPKREVTCRAIMVMTDRMEFFRAWDIIILVFDCPLLMAVLIKSLFMVSIILDLTSLAIEPDILQPKTMDGRIRWTGS